MSRLHQIRTDLKKVANPQKAVFLQRFFKTGEGEYGFGDVFLGITVPQQRSIAVKYKEAFLSDITTLLQSEIHEERLVALLILVLQFQKGDEDKKKEIYDFYLSHTKYINNWDLVDSSADKIVGGYLLKEEKKAINILETLAKSESIWERRIAMIATYQFIKNGSAEEALTIAEILVHDKHDLIQKAVGWMLRELGKRCSQEAEEIFLKKHYKTMPRTMLRYAIERFPEEKRKMYLSGTM